MGNIVLLDELTINKIAAGEVIERPASVIKEMVENSIDANATNITIDIRNGGISYIKITDNGKGIAKDDLEMAFERHATSKIRTAEDLNTVVSMGFRGEAMASIAAISNVELISKTSEQEIGYKIVVEGGNVIEKEETGCQTGTTITVKNLFFNTPVRYKFLKKDYTETGYIEDVVTRLALVNPNIAFKLINTGKTILQTSGNGDLKSVIYSVYGKDITQEIIDVNYIYEDMKITGVVGSPEIARSNRSNQLFFVNKRYVKDKILTAATEQAYKGKIDAGKFGFVVLNIEMPPSKVDVNVHPAKLEVRFEEESKVIQAIYHAIKGAIEKNTTDTITKVDNIIIQSNSYEPKVEIQTSNVEEKSKTSGLFGWRRNKTSNDYIKNDKNIIEDLYNKKKSDEFPIAQLDKDSFKTTLDNEEMEDENIVNTSDVLQELKHIQDNIKKDAELENLKNDETNIETKKGSELDEEEKKLPDGQTYTYVGENKEKIEDLLRQLHPETYKPKEYTSKTYDAELNYKEIKQEEAVAEDNASYLWEENKETENRNKEFETLQEQESEMNELSNEITQQENETIEQNNENRLDKEQITQKFNLIKENLHRLDETQSIPVIEEEYQKEERTDNTADTEEIISKEGITEGITEEEINNKQIDEDDEGPKPKAFQKPLNSNNANFNQMYEKLFGTAVIEDKTPEIKDERFDAVDIIKDNVSVFESIPTYQIPTYKYIGMVFEHYMIAEIEKEMYIINICTAKEKVIYEKLKKTYYNKVEKNSQMLLLPDIIELSEKQKEIVKENNYMLETTGFVFEEFGENTIKLTGVPTICMDLDTNKLFIDILNEINTVARTSKQEKEEKFLTTIASRVAQNSNEEETIENINSLMDELLSSPNPFEYNFEKPIAIKMTKYDIERKFSRK